MNYKKKIIINADDFGISSSANQAIIQLFQQQKISSATLMANMDDCTREAIEMAIAHHLPVGLHFNLTLGRPISQGLKTLTNEQGQFYSRRQFESRIMQLSLTEIKRELTAQYELLLASHVVPTHLDSHQHIHNWPKINKIVTDFAADRNIGLRLVKEPILFSNYGVSINSIAQLFRKTISYSFALLNERHLHHKQVKHNSKLLSFFAICPRPADMKVEHYQLILAKMAEYCELMVHPLIDKKDTLTKITDYSVREYQILKDLELSEYELISYRNL